MTKLGSRELHICPKVTKMGSIIGHRIDYNGVGALRDQWHIPSKNFFKYLLLPPPPPLPPSPWYLRQIKDQLIHYIQDGLCTQQRMIPYFVIELTGKDY